MMLELVNTVGKHTGSRCLRRFGCVNFTLEIADRNLLTFNLNLSSPFFRLLEPGNPSIFRRPPKTRKVLDVFPLRETSKIQPCAVEGSAVNVVPFETITGDESKKLPMQQNGFPLLADLGRSTCISFRVQAPSPLVDPVGIGSIDDGVGADRAASGSQGDANGILIKHRAHLRCQSPAVTAARGHFASMNCTTTTSGGGAS